MPRSPALLLIPIVAGPVGVLIAPGPAGLVVSALIALSLAAIAAGAGWMED